MMLSTIERSCLVNTDSLLTSWHRLQLSGNKGTSSEFQIFKKIVQRTVDLTSCLNSTHKPLWISVTIYTWNLSHFLLVPCTDSRGSFAALMRIAISCERRHFNFHPQTHFENVSPLFISWEKRVSWDETMTMFRNTDTVTNIPNSLTDFKIGGCPALFYVCYLWTLFLMFFLIWYWMVFEK